MHIVLPFIILVFTYLSLSADFQTANIILGMVVAVGILALLRPRRTAVNWRQLPAAMKAVAVYTVRLLFNMFRSGIHMARIILDPKLPLKSGIVSIPPACTSNTGRALNAHAISLPPGELVIEMDAAGTMFIHTLDVDTTLEQVEASQEIQQKLLKRMFDQNGCE